MYPQPLNHVLVISSEIIRLVICPLINLAAQRQPGWLCSPPSEMDPSTATTVAARRCRMGKITTTVNAALHPAPYGQEMRNLMNNFSERRAGHRKLITAQREMQ